MSKRSNPSFSSNDVESEEIETNKRRRSEPHIELAKEKNGKSEADILRSLFTYWIDDKAPLSDDRIQEAIDAGLSRDLWSKICDLYGTSRQAKLYYSYYPFSEAGYSSFHSWLADSILNTQNPISESSAQPKVIVDLTQTPEDEQEEEGGLEQLTAAWVELTRFETFESSKNDDPSYQEYLKVQKFEETKHDNASYQDYLKVQKFEDTKHDNASYQEYTALKEFENMKTKESPLYQDFSKFQYFHKAKTTDDPVYQEYASFQRIRLSRTYRVYLGFKSFENAKDKNLAYKDYLAFVQFQKTINTNSTYQEYLATTAFRKSKHQNAYFKEYQAFENFKTEKATGHDNYLTFTQYESSKSTMDTKPVVKQMKRVQHLQQLMKKSTMGKAAGS